MSEKKTTVAETTVTEKRAKASASTKTVKNDGFCVYLGPTITGLIQEGTIYRGTKETVVVSLDKAIKKYPLIKSLIVTNEDLVEARVKVKTPGNILYVSYHKVASGKY